MNSQAATEPGAAQTEVVDLGERNWLPRHHRGDPNAFCELLTAYRTLVMTLLFRYGVENAHRDDLFQEVFLKVHRAAGRYRPSEPLRPWLVSIVINTVRNHRRASGRRRHAMIGWRDQSDMSNRPNAETGREASREPTFDDGRAPGPEVTADQAATLTWLEGQIAELPDAQRDVLVLSTIKGLRMKEIANLLRVPENTVKTQLRRARLSLAERLAKRDDPAFAAGGDPS